MSLGQGMRHLCSLWLCMKGGVLLAGDFSKRLRWRHDANTGCNPVLAFCWCAEVDFGLLRVVPKERDHAFELTPEEVIFGVLSKHTLNTSHSFRCRPVMVLLEFLATFDVSGSLAVVLSKEGIWEPSQMVFFCSSHGSISPDMVTNVCGDNAELPTLFTTAVARR